MTLQSAVPMQFHAPAALQGQLPYAHTDSALLGYRKFTNKVTQVAGSDTLNRGDFWDVTLCN
jgi:hypothetical protein